MNIRRSYRGRLAMLACLLGSACIAQAQTAPLTSEDVAITVDSGFVSNDGNAPAVVYSAVVEVPGATWLRLDFDKVVLAGDPNNGTGSYFQITSRLDGGLQILNAEHLRQWHYTSAYFNGDAVEIELVAEPGTGQNRFTMSTVVAGVPDLDKTICGNTDDRQLSDDPRQGRLMPIGCTAWMIDDANHCFLTAGHCSSGNVVEFNVPLSSSGGSINHPPPEDQYSVDPVSVQSNGGQGIGNDWAYFGCFPNSITGLTPYQAQGDYYILADDIPPMQGQDIRITGYGTVSAPVDPRWNQVQKTHVGPLVTSSGTLVQYRTDTSGGNSGSPVVDDVPGLAIGIHTHGGCNSSGGQNSGTGINHPGLQDALANPKGVCIPNTGIDVQGGNFLSEGPKGGPFTPDHADYIIINRESSPLEYAVSVSENWLDLSSTGGTIPADSQITVTVSLNSLADSLGNGGYNAVISFTNITNGDGDTTRDANLRVGVPQLVYDWNMDTNPGWTTEGQWDYGQPTGSGGEYGNPDPSSGHTGANVMGYNLGGDYSNNMPEYDLTTTAIDCSTLAGTTLKFWRYLNVETSTYDHAYVRVSNDGTNWTDAWTNTSEITDSAWSQYEYDISAVADGQSTVYVRWTMGTTDGSWRFSGWNIDDVEIWGIAPDDCPPDWNGDTLVNSQDFIAFLNDFTAGNADYNGDTVTDSQDFIAFLNDFVAGC